MQPYARSANARAARASHARSILILLALILAAPAAAAVFTVGPPGNTAQCTHPTIQAAIDAAGASPGLDIIRLARGTYPAQRLIVGDAGDLAIEGGFLECATLVHVDTSTLDGQGASPTGPVIRHLGSGQLTLADLGIVNGVASGVNPYGGGVASSGSGKLTMYRSLVANNRAVLGGGLYVVRGGVAAPVKEVELLGVGFLNNTATRSGGGMYAKEASVRITGEELGYFAGNHADGTDINDGGGALHAINSDVTIDSRPPLNFPFMDGNWAESVGGAIYFGVLEAGDHHLRIGGRPFAGPMTLANNFARTAGGAVYIRATAAGASNHARGRLTDTVLSGNRTPYYGTAIYLYAAGDIGSYAELAMRAGTACSAQQRCNRVDGNFGGGATIELERGGAQGLALFEMERGHLVNNVASLSSGLIFGEGYVRIDNSLLANNDAGGSALISAGSDEIVILNSTIANNIRVTPGLIRTFAANDDLVLHNSIAYQPGVPILQTATGPTVNLRNLLVGSGHGLTNLAARNIGDQLDPLFVNPGQGNFQLQPGSQARNRWSPGGGVNVPTVDLLGALRPAPPSGPTPYDFGAYEYGAVVDLIFSDSFDRN